MGMTRSSRCKFLHEEFGLGSRIFFWSGKKLLPGKAVNLASLKRGICQEQSNSFYIGSDG